MEPIIPIFEEFPFSNDENLKKILVQAAL